MKKIVQKAYKKLDKLFNFWTITFTQIGGTNKI